MPICLFSRSGDRVHLEKEVIPITRYLGRNVTNLNLSVFYKDAGGNVHTYSTYGRGVEPLIGTYMILHLVPKGRDEEHLGFTMEWVLVDNS
jgi:predicted dithiol-disulfide oxidoreductase (DUF899 family)